MNRLSEIEYRAEKARPRRRESPAREANISDREVEEVVRAVATIRPGAVVNIGTVVTGCPCEDGPTCTDQVWIVTHMPGSTAGFLLSRIDDHWTVGPVQGWWWDYERLLAREGWHGSGADKLLERFPVCAVNSPASVSKAVK